MTKSVIVHLYPPLAMGAVGRVLKAVAREWPDATVTGSTNGGMVVSAAPDLTPTEARRAVAARRAAR